MAKRLTDTRTDTHYYQLLSLAAKRFGFVHPVWPHSSLGFLTPEQFRRAADGGYGKAGPSGTLENSSGFPLSHSLDGGDNSPNSSLSSRT